MGENSKIEWCHHTFNPWIGCQEVDAACDLCYARVQNEFRHWVKGWGPHGERKRTSTTNWRKPIAWARAARELGVRHRVFCASLADWLDNQAQHIWRKDLCELIAETPELDWLLLTKRIENFDRLAPWHASDVPPNVWLGITAGDQAAYARGWPILREIAAPVRFISHEPALSPLTDLSLGYNVLPDWIIMGGESGKGARYMDPEWARTTLDVCDRLDIAFFMKQMTGKQPIPDDLLIREFPTPRARAKEAA